jgi:HPt (histidine-containing phosphotransfer) domain-containing protein
MYAFRHSSGGARADLDFWRDLSEGSDDDGRDLLALYLRDTSEQILRMISSLADGRIDDVAVAAHACAGSSGTCGVASLARLCRQLECEARDQQQTAMSDTLPRIVETFDGIHERLTKAIAAPSCESTQTRGGVSPNRGEERR